MLATAQSCAVIGLDGLIVQVEVDISPGLPAFNIVGLPDTAVQEARERVRAALRNSGCEFPMRRITVNLAPADLKKAGPAYDLPIAVGILLSSGQVRVSLEQTIFLGELSLDGSLRHTTGILAMVSVARQQGYRAAFVPDVDCQEAALVEGIQVYPVPNLATLICHLRDKEPIAPLTGSGVVPEDTRPLPDGINLSFVKGQEHAKRALEVAAAGFTICFSTAHPAAERLSWPAACPRYYRRCPRRRLWRSPRFTVLAGLCPPTVRWCCEGRFGLPTTPYPMRDWWVAVEP